MRVCSVCFFSAAADLRGCVSVSGRVRAGGRGRGRGRCASLRGRLMCRRARGLLMCWRGLGRGADNWLGRVCGLVCARAGPRAGRLLLLLLLRRRRPCMRRRRQSVFLLRCC